MIPDGTLICPKCGKPQIKKPIYKKWWFVLIVVFLVCSIIGFLFPHKNGRNEYVVAAEDWADDALKDSATAKVPNVAEKAESTSSLSMDSIVAIVEDILSDTYDDVQVTLEETTLVLDVTFPGLASAVQDIVTVRSSKLLNKWDEVIVSQTKICSTVMNVLYESGYKDVDVLVNVLNDLNPKNCLLSIFNESVIYDVVNNE